MISLIDRFEQYIFYSPDGCWYWTGALGNSKQPHNANRARFSVKGINCIAARVSFELYRGQIPENICVCHHCDNPLCVNPNHLFLGTRKDNAEDMVKKNRSNVGTRHSRCKLTDVEVKEIRELYNNGSLCSELSVKYNISEVNVFFIVSKRSWKHLN